MTPARNGGWSTQSGPQVGNRVRVQEIDIAAYDGNGNDAAYLCICASPNGTMTPQIDIRTIVRFPKSICNCIVPWASVASNRLYSRSVGYCREAHFSLDIAGSQSLMLDEIP